MKFDVRGMTCGHCVTTITRAIQAVGGEASVDLAAGTVFVTGVDQAEVARKAIESEGYEAIAVDPQPELAAGEPAAATCCGTCHT